MNINYAIYGICLLTYEIYDLLMVISKIIFSKNYVPGTSYLLMCHMENACYQKTDRRISPNLKILF